VRWAEPTLVCEIEFRGWTADGLVRQGSFKELREDKAAENTVLETGAPNASSFPFDDLECRCAFEQPGHRFLDVAEGVRKNV
jgi:hypothetical protein